MDSNAVQASRVHGIWSAIAAISLLLAGGFAAAAVEGDRAPDWELDDINGVEVAYPQAAAGNTSILLFWASWCPYCKAVMPYLEDIRKEYADHGVQVFAINIKEDGDPLAFLQEHKLNFTTLLYGDLVAEQYAVRYTPGIFVVAGDGTIVFRRKSTELPAGQKVAEYWAEQVRESLDESIAAANDD